LLQRWLHWRLPWRGLPLSRQSKFRWLWLQQWHLHPLRLQLWQRHWPLPRWRVRFHLRQLLQLGQLSLRLLQQSLWQRHRQRQ
jgi:hypothetical protein